MTSAKTTFQLPKDGQTYHTEIIDRCTELINYGIWGGLHISRLRSWMNNFSTDEEKYFAASILDHLIYRSKEQTIALIDQLFHRIIPDLTRLDPSPIGRIETCLPDLQNDLSDPGIRLVAAVKQKDPTTTSAPEISRFMKRHLSISESWIAKPWEIPSLIDKGIRVFIFIDDFLGTGEQFIELLDEENIDKELIERAYFVYTPLVAHEVGINNIKAKRPALRIKSVEFLGPEFGVFHPQSRCFADGINTPEAARDFYYELLSTRRIIITGLNRLGFGQLELAYAFEHATPDNCLPILWWPHSSAWTPLFDR
ncbi:MAG: hypothetical protein QOE33_3048 [Acidobacteriota bacterium]|nr:hypothetical protein [Acidobacteriota bacterium]